MELLRGGGLKKYYVLIPTKDLFGTTGFAEICIVQDHMVREIIP